MSNYDPYLIADRVLLGIGKYEHMRLRDNLNYANQENLFLKYLGGNRYHFYDFYDDYYDDDYHHGRRHHYGRHHHGRHHRGRHHH